MPLLDSPRMKTTRHGEHVWKLTRFGAVNCYLVAEDDGFTLVDTGIAGSAKAILAGARAQGRPLRRIALTHAHGDHVGSLDALASEGAGVEVVIGAREARFLRRDMSLDPGEAQTKVKGGFPKIETRPGRELAPGDRVGSLEVVAAPGHTPGQVAYLDVRDRTLIAGDAMQTLGGVAVAGVVKPRFPFPGLATWHLPTALVSARALRDLDPSRLAVGHGRVIEHPLEALNAALADAEARVAR